MDVFLTKLSFLEKTAKLRVFVKKGRETPSSFPLVTLSNMVYLALLLSEGQRGYHVFLFDCRKCAHVFVFDIFTQKIRIIKKKDTRKICVICTKGIHL